MKLTPEQQIILTAATTEKKFLVEAVAGSGKTTTAVAIADELLNQGCEYILYTAFNKAIITDTSRSMDSKVQCKTLHSLAYAVVKPKKVEPLTYGDFSAKYTYKQKSAMMQTIKNFCLSASTDMYEYFEDCAAQDMLTDAQANECIRTLTMMINEERSVTFDFMLKYLHLVLLETPKALNYDAVILDEIQDTSEVALEIFKALNVKHKIGLGDPHQSIYSFLNLVDGFEVLQDFPVYSLTQSFRCSTQIADKISDFYKKYSGQRLHFKGIDDPIEDGKVAYISRLNSSMILTLHSLHKANVGYTLTRSLQDIFACPIALYEASKGKPVKNPQYKFLMDEYEKYVESGAKQSFHKWALLNIDNDEIESTIIMLAELPVNFFTVLSDAKKVVENENIVVGTAHSLKGLGFSDVYINRDFTRAINNLPPVRELTDDDYELIRLSYVAFSRARCRLHYKEL